MNLCSRFHQSKDLENPCEIPVSTLSALCLSIVVLVAVECHALKRCTPDMRPASLLTSAVPRQSAG